MGMRKTAVLSASAAFGVLVVCAAALLLAQ
jgi:hypothetical protein